MDSNIKLSEHISAMDCLIGMYECDIVELKDRRFLARLRRFFAPLFSRQ